MATILTFEKINNSLTKSQYLLDKFGAMLSKADLQLYTSIFGKVSEALCFHILERDYPETRIEDMADLKEGASGTLEFQALEEIEFLSKFLLNNLSLSVTSVRKGEIVEIVIEKSDRLLKRHGLLQIHDKVTEWLSQEPKKDPRLTRQWIQTGWDLLKGELSFPFGKCDCGVALFPKTIERWDGKKVKKLFKECSDCYIDGKGKRK